MRRLSIYLMMLVFSIALFSCKKGGEVIPRSEMSQIYAEMFLLDQKIGSEFKLRRIADTTLVYEAVLQKYGYTLEDYLASQEHYIRDSRRYAKMLKKSVAIIQKESRVLKAEKSRIDALVSVRSGLKRFAPHRVCLLDTMTYSDSLFGFDFQEGLDTAYYGPRMVVWADTVQKGKSLVKVR